MKQKDLVQTAIIVCSVLMIPIFSFAYYLYSQTDLKLFEVLDKSFGVTAGLFGGAATLTAAYIASLLFNDWRHAHNMSVDTQMCLKGFDFIQNLDIKLMNIRMFMLRYFRSDPKLDLNKEFRKHVHELEIIANETAIIFSNFGFFIPKDEFDSKFKPQFEAIIDVLEFYIKTCHERYRFDQGIASEEYIATYIQLNESLRARYRATFFELRSYYKALK